MGRSQSVPNLGTRLRIERSRLALSQQVVAARGGVTVNTQVAYEQGMRSPDAGYLANVAALGIDVWFLLFGISQGKAAMEVISWELLGKIENGIDGWLRETGVDLPHEKRGELSRLLLARFDLKPEVSLEEVQASLSKIA